MIPSSAGRERPEPGVLSKNPGPPEKTEVRLPKARHAMPVQRVFRMSGAWRAGRRRQHTRESPEACRKRKRDKRSRAYWNRPRPWSRKEDCAPLDPPPLSLQWHTPPTCTAEWTKTPGFDFVGRIIVLGISLNMPTTQSPRWSRDACLCQ
eukprot:5084645-Amphidinium_carterae.1